MYLKLRLSGQDAKTHARNPVAPPAALPRSAPTFW